MKITTLEEAVLKKMISDLNQSPEECTALNPDQMIVTERNFDKAGFMTTFEKTSASRIYEGDVTVQWGNVMGRLNSNTDVDFVVFVNKGYVTDLEGCTFGGGEWPSSIEEFELIDHSN